MLVQPGVEVHHSVKVRCGETVYGAQHHDTRAVDENVQRAGGKSLIYFLLFRFIFLLKFPDSVLHCLLTILLLREVVRQSDDLPGSGSQTVLLDLLQRLLVPRHQGQAGPEGGEVDGDSGSDARAGSGDENDFTSEGDLRHLGEQFKYYQEALNTETQLVRDRQQLNINCCCE